MRHRVTRRLTRLQTMYNVLKFSEKWWNNVKKSIYWNRNATAMQQQFCQFNNDQDCILDRSQWSLKTFWKIKHLLLMNKMPLLGRGLSKKKSVLYIDDVWAFGWRLSGHLREPAQVLLDNQLLFSSSSNGSLTYLDSCLSGWTSSICN